MNKMQMVELSHELRQISDIDEFWRHIRKALAQYGVTSILYGASATMHDIVQHRNMQPFFWKGDHPREWFETFGMDDFLEEEMGVDNVMIGCECLVWHAPETIAQATPKELERIMLEREMGLYTGFSIPTMMFDKNNIGAIGVSTGELSPDEFSHMWPDKRREIMSICSLLDMGMRQRHLRSVVGLSPRQQEMLTWLAAGLTPSQIGDRLALADKTVSHHIEAAKRKLNTCTRDHAVAKALLLNLISP